MLVLKLMIIAVVIIIAAIIMIKIENKKYRITEYTYATDKVSREIVLAVISDLHNYVYGNDNDSLINSLEKIAPDYVISAGDMIEDGKCAASPKGTIEFLKRLSEHFKFIYGCGNHEWKLMAWSGKLNDEFKQGIKDGKIDPVNNRVIEFEKDNINVYGLNLEREYFKKVVLNQVSVKHMEELIGKPQQDRLNILIGHNPDQFDAYTKWGADMVLSGHIHGGIIATPWHRGMISPRFVLFPKYDWGVYNKDNTTMFLSRGLGNHTVHVRIFNRAEIMVIKILPKR